MVPEKDIKVHLIPQDAIYEMTEQIDQLSKMKARHRKQLVPNTCICKKELQVYKVIVITVYTVYLDVLFHSSPFYHSTFQHTSNTIYQKEIHCTSRSHKNKLDGTLLASLSNPNNIFPTHVQLKANAAMHSIPIPEDGKQTFFKAANCKSANSWTHSATTNPQISKYANPKSTNMYGMKITYLHISTNYCTTLS